jgi:hypothetical protein
VKADDDPSMWFEAANFSRVICTKFCIDDASVPPLPLFQAFDTTHTTCQGYMNETPLSQSHLVLIYLFLSSFLEFVLSMVHDLNHPFYLSF